MGPKKHIELAVAGRVFRVRCPGNEETRLRKAAELVERKIADLRARGGIVDSGRLALLAALHLAHELLVREEDSFHHSPEYEDIQKRLRLLAEEIETNLSE
jgi:cell division protein ZapA